MNKTQVLSFFTPIIGALAGWLAMKVPFLDQATWNTLITSIVTGVVSFVLIYLNRGTALADTVGNMPGTRVVTTPEIANALPNNPDVVANTENRVVSTSTPRP